MQKNDSFDTKVKNWTEVFCIFDNDIVVQNADFFLWILKNKTEVENVEFFRWIFIESLTLNKGKVNSLSENLLTFPRDIDNGKKLCYTLTKVMVRNDCYKYEWKDN